MVARDDLLIEIEKARAVDDLCDDSSYRRVSLRHETETLGTDETGYPRHLKQRPCIVDTYEKGQPNFAQQSHMTCVSDEVEHNRRGYTVFVLDPRAPSWKPPPPCCGHTPSSFKMRDFPATLGIQGVLKQK